MDLGYNSVIQPRAHYENYKVLKRAYYTFRDSRRTKNIWQTDLIQMSFCICNGLPSLRLVSNPPPQKRKGLKMVVNWCPGVQTFYSSHGHSSPLHVWHSTRYLVNCKDFRQDPKKITNDEGNKKHFYFQQKSWMQRVYKIVNQALVSLVKPKVYSLDNEARN